MTRPGDDRRDGPPDRRSNWHKALFAPLLGDLAMLEDDMYELARKIDIGVSGSAEAAAYAECAERIRRVRVAVEDTLK